MPLNPIDLLRPSTPDQDLPGAPLAGTNSQSVQRLQIGLFGLAAMVLLVALANIIRNNAEQNQATVVPEAAPGAAQQKSPAVSDPLADAGVVPEAPVENPAAGNAAPPPR